MAKTVGFAAPPPANINPFGAGIPGMLLAILLFAGGAAQALEISNVFQCMGIGWEAEKGFTYGIHAATSLTGTWSQVDAVVASTNAMRWADLDTPDHRSRFYRISAKTVLLAAGTASEYSYVSNSWVRNNEPAIFTVNPVDLSILSYAWVTNEWVWHKLAVSPSGEIWGLRGSSTLARIDPDTWEPMYYDDIMRDSIIHSYNAIEFGPDGTLWGVEYVMMGQQKLVKIGTSSFEATLIGDMENSYDSFPTEMAATADGLYVSGHVGTTGESKLYAVSTNVGSMSFVGQIYPAESDHRISSLAFSPGGRLYAVDDPNVTRVITVSTDDGSPTVIGELGAINTSVHRVVFSVDDMAFWTRP